MTPGPGHLFVVHGNLTRFAFDAVAIPVDNYWHTATDWGRYAPRPVDRVWQQERVSQARETEGVLLRYVDTGFDPDDADVADLGRRVTAVCEALASDVGAPTSASAARTGRPLVGLPLVGTGAGGFDDVRGTALREVAARATEVADATGVDFAVVCFDRADYVATQTNATDRRWAALDEREQDEADRLGRQVRAGNLALFLGAGVSMAAGVPGYGRLLQALDPQLGPIKPGDEPGVAEQLLGRRTAADLRPSLLQALDAPGGHALQHGLLASLRVDDVITTNFDALYEHAASTPYEHDVPVLPWDTVSGRQRYLLKLHGDPARDDQFVLTAAHFAAFAANHDAERSILQALMLLGRELLFVGYRLQDTNVRSVLDTTISATTRHGANAQRLATVLSVDASQTRDTNRRRDVGLLHAGEGGIADRRLEVFLDRVAHVAALEEPGWLLDPRYVGLADDGDQEAIERLASLRVPPSSRWAALRRLITSFGG